MKTPPVAVCLTSYKRGHIISKTIESILAQDFGDFELAISDDASGDETEETCRAYEKLDKRVRFIKQSVNIGMPGNLLAAISATSAPLVVNLHDGDTFHPSLISKWKAALDENPNAGFAFCQVVHLDADGKPSRIRAPELPRDIPQYGLVRYMLSPGVLFDCPVWGTVMGRRLAYSEVGGFDRRYSFYSDVAMWIRLNLRGSVIYVQEPLMNLHHGEADRPFASTNWALAQISVSIYEEAIDGLYAGDPVTIARERKRLYDLRDIRWLKAIGSCAKRDHLRQLEDGIKIFAANDSVTLRSAAQALNAYLIARRHFPSIYALVNYLAKIVT